METTLKSKIEVIMSGMEESARRAYYFTSMSPDRRAKDFITGYTELLLENAEEMTEKGVSESTVIWYAEKFKSLILSWLARKSRCASSMITGPANFPVARNRKALNAEHAASELFHHWEEYAKKKCIRNAQPRKTNETEILRLTEKLEEAEQAQTLMKKYNRLYPKFKKYIAKAGDDANAYVFAEANGLNPKAVETYFFNHVESYNTKNVIFPAFSLTNNNARITGMKARIAELERKESAKTVSALEFELEGGTLEISYASERINIYHEEKPAREVIDRIKKAGFRWSHSYKSWTRQLTENALFACRISFPELNLPRRAY